MVPNGHTGYRTSSELLYSEYSLTSKIDTKRESSKWDSFRFSVQHTCGSFEHFFGNTFLYLDNRLLVGPRLRRLLGHSLSFSPKRSGQFGTLLISGRTVELTLEPFLRLCVGGSLRWGPKELESVNTLLFTKNKIRGDKTLL